MKDEKILTKHPQKGKQGVRISKAKYDLVSRTVLDILRAHPDMTFGGLLDAAEGRLAGKFEGSVGWYVTTVKLDLEARQVIERIPKSSPQQLRIAGNRRTRRH